MSTDPPVTTLCGSTRFKHEYDMVNRRLSLQGEIVISCGLFAQADNIFLTQEEKAFLDELHLRKIDLSSGIFVINVGGYVGESTSREIDYAVKHDKQVRYLEPIKEQARDHDRPEAGDRQPEFDYGIYATADGNLGYGQLGS